MYVDYEKGKEDSLKKGKVYSEALRPQFHYTAKANWLNDPNGLVFVDGVYHLFYQYNPFGTEWGNMTWGHAVSKNLVHWKQRPDAIEPYSGGDIYSGSAVVDLNNTSGLGKGGKGPLVAFFTHARKPACQAMAYSVDKGKTWSLYNDGEPVVPCQGLDEIERDPRVFFHEESQKWVMLLWVSDGHVRFFGSSNLIHWNQLSDFYGEGFFECPDMIRLPVDGHEEDVKWVLYDGGFHYWTGTFDGKSFQAERGPHKGDYGSHFFAAQTWTNVPDRVIQIAWMQHGTYPEMPFSQQMSFPCELFLARVNEGVRLCRRPVRELAILREREVTVSPGVLTADECIPFDSAGDCFEIKALVNLSQEGQLCFEFFGQKIEIGSKTVMVNQNHGQLSDAQGQPSKKSRELSFHILVDRTSIEVFADRGQLVLSSCFIPEDHDLNLTCFCRKGDVEIITFSLWNLKSIWSRK